MRATVASAEGPAIEALSISKKRSWTKQVLQDGATTKVGLLCSRYLNGLLLFERRSDSLFLQTTVPNSTAAYILRSRKSTDDTSGLTVQPPSVARVTQRVETKDSLAERLPISCSWCSACKVADCTLKRLRPSTSQQRASLQQYGHLYYRICLSPGFYRHSPAHDVNLVKTLQQALFETPNGWPAQCSISGHLFSREAG